MTTNYFYTIVQINHQLWRWIKQVHFNPSMKQRKFESEEMFFLSFFSNDNRPSHDGSCAYGFVLPQHLHVSILSKSCEISKDLPCIACDCRDSRSIGLMVGNGLGGADKSESTKLVSRIVTRKWLSYSLTAALLWIVDVAITPKRVHFLTSYYSESNLLSAVFHPSQPFAPFHLPNIWCSKMVGRLENP